MRNLKEAEAGAVREGSRAVGDDELSEIWYQSDEEVKEQAIRLLTQMAYNHITAQSDHDD